MLIIFHSMTVADQIVAAVVVLANLATAARLFGYQRHGARYRVWAAVLAYLLIMCTGGQALDVLFNQVPVTLWQAGVAVVLAVLVYRARGNVARIVRLQS